MSESLLSGGGGGGGAGSQGSSTVTESTWKGGNGGDGKYIDMEGDGNARYYAAGGAGGGSGIANAGNGGLGGGGSAASSNGQDNSGSGGAGNSELDLLEPSTAGTGGSGKVLIRYLKDSKSLYEPELSATPLNIEYIKVDDRDVTLVWNPPNDEGLKTYYFIDFKLSSATAFRTPDYILSNRYKTYKTFSMPSYGIYDFRISIPKEGEETNFIHGPIQRVPVVDVNSFPIITKAEYNNNFNNIEILFDKVDTNSVIRWKKKGENDWSDPIAAPALRNYVTAGILLDGDVIQIQSGLVISPDFPPIYRSSNRSCCKG